MNLSFSWLLNKSLKQILLLLSLVGFQTSIHATAAKDSAESKAKAQPQDQAQSSAQSNSPTKEQEKAKLQAEQASLGEDPGPVYTQVVLQWAKVTNFAQNAAEVIVGKFKLEMENDPKLKQVMTPELLADLEQFFYELFLSPETIKELAIVYSQYFTLDDMQELIKFYQSPVGQKLIKADPQIKIKTQKIGELLLKKHEKEYMAIIGKYLIKAKSQTN